MDGYFNHLTTTELLRLVDNSDKTTSMERELASRLADVSRTKTYTELRAIESRKDAAYEKARSNLRNMRWAEVTGDEQDA